MATGSSGWTTTRTFASRSTRGQRPAPPDEGERLVQRRVQWHVGDPVAIAEGVEERAGDEGVAEATGGELQGGPRVLHLNPCPNGGSSALGALGELSAGGVLVA